MHDRSTDRDMTMTDADEIMHLQLMATVCLLHVLKRFPAAEICYLLLKTNNAVEVCVNKSPINSHTIPRATQDDPAMANSPTALTHHAPPPCYRGGGNGQKNHRKKKLAFFSIQRRMSGGTFLGAKCSSEPASFKGTPCIG